MTEIAASNSRTAFFQAIITIILTVITVLATMIMISLNKVLTNQEEVGKELVRIKTIQDENTSKINYHINKFEFETIKEWVDKNYIRKQQE